MRPKATKNFLALGMSILLGILAGCGSPEGYINANPQTSGSFGSFKFRNNKDAKVTVSEAWYNPQTRAFYIKDLDIDDNASNVRTANVPQIDAATNYNRVLGEAWANGFLAAGQAGTQLAGAIIPGGLPALALARGQAASIRGLSQPNIGFTGPGGIGFNRGLGTGQADALAAWISSQSVTRELESALSPAQVKAARAAMDIIAAEEAEAIKAAAIAELKAQLAELQKVQPSPGPPPTQPE